MSEQLTFSDLPDSEQDDFWDNLDAFEASLAENTEIPPATEPPTYETAFLIYLDGDTWFSPPEIPAQLRLKRRGTAQDLYRGANDLHTFVQAQQIANMILAYAEVESSSKGA
mgnify:CR=1 FL=1